MLKDFWSLWEVEKGPNDTEAQQILMLKGFYGSNSSKIERVPRSKEFWSSKGFWIQFNLIINLILILRKFWDSNNSKVEKVQDQF